MKNLSSFFFFALLFLFHIRVSAESYEVEDLQSEIDQLRAVMQQMSQQYTEECQSSEDWGSECATLIGKIKGTANRITTLENVMWEKQATMDEQEAEKQTMIDEQETEELQEIEQELRDESSRIEEDKRKERAQIAKEEREEKRLYKLLAVIFGGLLILMILFAFIFKKTKNSKQHGGKQQ
ncbi:hypothetical protein [Peribacillus simplex]|uniref:hypothetical protein n=1 Tax=Peribacillus simplex TaxID=1478 RepID=UPI003D282843